MPRLSATNRLYIAKSNEKNLICHFSSPFSNIGHSWSLFLLLETAFIFYFFIWLPGPHTLLSLLWCITSYLLSISCTTFSSVHCQNIRALEFMLWISFLSTLPKALNIMCTYNCQILFSSCNSSSTLDSYPTTFPLDCIINLTCPTVSIWSLPQSSSYNLPHSSWWQSHPSTCSEFILIHSLFSFSPFLISFSPFLISFLLLPTLLTDQQNVLLQPTKFDVSQGSQLPLWSTPPLSVSWIIKAAV